MLRILLCLLFIGSQNILHFAHADDVGSGPKSTVKFHVLVVSLNSTVFLKCEGDGTNVSWTNPSGDLVSFGDPNSGPFLIPRPRIGVDPIGTLIIREIVREDGGYYWCTRDENLANATVWHVMIDPNFRFGLELESITYGWYAGLGALIIGITVGIMKIIVRVCCPTCHARASAAARVQQMRQLIVSLETYRHEQAAKIWENYNSQAAKLKESCALQIEGLRDHYSTKITRFRNYRLPFVNFRDQYWQQVSRVRDYSSAQSERLQDNYAKNMARLRSYSVAQLERFRQQYQLQHKHMAKILEAMNFNLDQCRSGDITPSDATVINMEISIANLNIDQSDVNHGSFDSISGAVETAPITVHADCVQVISCSEYDAASLEYLTPPRSSSPLSGFISTQAEITEERTVNITVESPLIEPVEEKESEQIMDAPDPFKAFIT